MVYACPYMYFNSCTLAAGDGEMIVHLAIINELQCTFRNHISVDSCMHESSVMQLKMHLDVF